MIKQQGFTLIELVTTLILIAILAVTALPRLLGRSGFEEVAIRDELVARLRLVQWQAMNGDFNTCHQLVIAGGQFGVSQNSHLATGEQCSLNPSLENVTELDRVSIAAQRISFNRLGQPTEECTGGCTIVVSGKESATLTIEAEGFIHAQ